MRGPDAPGAPLLPPGNGFATFFNPVRPSEQTLFVPSRFKESSVSPAPFPGSTLTLFFGRLDRDLKRKVTPKGPSWGGAIPAGGKLTSECE